METSVVTSFPPPQPVWLLNLFGLIELTGGLALRTHRQKSFSSWSLAKNASHVNFHVDVISSLWNHIADHFKNLYLGSYWSIENWNCFKGKLLN